MVIHNFVSWQDLINEEDHFSDYYLIGSDFFFFFSPPPHAFKNLRKKNESLADTKKRRWRWRMWPTTALPPLDRELIQFNSCIIM